jgi:transposase
MGLGEAMVAARRIIALSVDADQRRELVDIARSRTEPANRVERAGIILAYLNEPSAYAVARTMGVSQPTVTRCLERAAEFGVLAALDDRARTGREATITAEARTWLVGLACAKPKQFGYPHELWTTRLLAAPARDHGPGAGHPSLAHLAQGTVCKILAAHDVKPHKVRYYLERRDPDFEPKMAEVLCVYREVAMRRVARAKRRSRSSLTTRNQASRRSARRLPICLRFPQLIRRSLAITSTSGTEQSP